MWFQLFSQKHCIWPRLFGLGYFSWLSAAGCVLFIEVKCWQDNPRHFRRAVMACAHFNCQIEMHESSQYYCEWLLTHVSHHGTHLQTMQNQVHVRMHLVLSWLIVNPASHDAHFSAPLTLLLWNKSWFAITRLFSHCPFKKKNQIHQNNSNQTLKTYNRSSNVIAHAYNQPMIILLLLIQISVTVTRDDIVSDTSARALPVRAIHSLGDPEDKYNS